MSRGSSIMVDLPTENPFGEAAPNPSYGPSGARSFGQPGTQLRDARLRHFEAEPDYEDDNYNRPGVTQLSNRNAYESQEPPRANRQGSQAARPAPRSQAGPRNTEERRYGGAAQMQHVNPFDARRGPNVPRVVEPIQEQYDDDEEEEEEEEDEDDYEDNFVNAPPPRPTNTAPRLRTTNLNPPQANGRQRLANTRDRRPSPAPEDDERLVISWVDENTVSPNRRPNHHYSS